ncbi:MAG: polysaccharide biosynthesis tyrosine autokinase [Gemmatimonadota bacterium]|jgi:capsular exopolysaccharide synthesis family protein
MSEDNLIPPGTGRSSVPVARHEAAAPSPYQQEAYLPAFEAENDAVDFRRYLFAILRYRWLLVIALVVGVAGAAVAWNLAEVTYTAEGSLYIEGDNRRQGSGDVDPIRPSTLLESSSWVELLRSYQVLDSVVMEQGLYVRPPKEFAEQFRGFGLAERVAFGSFELRIGPEGRDFVLATAAGAVVDEGRLGDPIGEEEGFRWTPPAGAFPPGAVVAFSVVTPRDASTDLRNRLNPQIDRNGDFLRVTLEGTNAQRITDIVNALMQRHVRLAADITRAKLDLTLEILEEQLAITNDSLAAAERRLEEFRVATITLPQDRSPIAVGLQETRNPVFDRYFEMSLRLDDVRRDRQRLAAALRSFDDAGEVRIEALEVIPSARESSELRRILDDLVDARSELRVLRDRYSDDYPPVQNLLGQIQSIEQRAIPRVVGGIIEQLDGQAAGLQEQIAQNSTELEEIPPRAIDEQRLRRLVETASTTYQDVRRRVESARLAAASAIPDVSILDEAEVPQQPTGDMRLLLAAGIFLGCLGVAAGGAILLDRTDARFRYASDVSREIGLDILGSIPRIEAGRGKKGVLNAAAALEAFRELRIHIGFAYGSAGPITLAISSPAAGEGKSLVASNLAVAFSEVGQRTLLVDADTRRGDAHKLIGRQQSPGLVDYLKERSGQEIIQKTDHGNLDFIGCGSRGTTTPELLASSRMAYFMGTLKRSYDVIIVDCPPLAAGGDAVILSTLTGNLAVVIRTGTTERALAQAKLDQLARLPIRILGAILNDVDPTDGYHYYYSAYLPGYEPIPEDGEDEGLKLIAGEAGEKEPA